jgi:protein-S-isoprenylcysteine O-methyltransferase Ste14
MVVGFFLLYDFAPPILDFLNHRFIPTDQWIRWVGALLAFAGALFAIWARATIGKNWSAEVQVKQDHQLIRSGPYAYIRHPICAGILLAVAGTALVLGEYRAILGLIVIFLGFARRAKKEEAFLATQFGPAFDEHKRHTGFFFLDSPKKAVNITSFAWSLLCFRTSETSNFRRFPIGVTS